MIKFWNYIRTWVTVRRKNIWRIISRSKNAKFTKFAIICAPRSGSTMLHTYLNSHPQILSHGELIRRKLERGETNISLYEHIFVPVTKKIKAVGVKLFYEYEEKEGYKKSFGEILEDNEVKIVHLMRKDFRRQYDSLKRARQTGVWSSTLKNLEPDEVEVHESEYEQHEQMQKMHITRFKKRLSSHQMIEVYYEDLTSNPKKLLKAIQEFLGVEPRQLFTLLEKQGK